MVSPCTANVADWRMSADDWPTMRSYGLASTTHLLLVTSQKARSLALTANRTVTVWPGASDTFWNPISFFSGCLTRDFSWWTESCTTSLAARLPGLVTSTLTSAVPFWPIEGEDSRILPKPKVVYDNPYPNGYSAGWVSYM